MHDDHARFRAQLAGHLAEVLSAEESAWMESHAAACAECRSLLERVEARLPEFAADAGHAPPALLSAWLREPGSFTPLERELLVRHLASCAECRADLEEMASFAKLPTPVFQPARAPGLWRGFGAAGLIAAAALVAMVVTRGFLPGARPVVAPPARPVPPAPLVTTIAEPLLTFGDHLRGGGAETPVADTLNGPTPRVRIRLPQIFLGGSDSVRVLVVGSGHLTVADRMLGAAELADVFRLTPTSGDWQGGSYELRVVPDAGRDSSATRRFPFVLIEAGH